MYHFEGSCGWSEKAGGNSLKKEGFILIEGVVIFRVRNVETGTAATFPVSPDTRISHRIGGAGISHPEVIVIYCPSDRALIFCLVGHRDMVEIFRLTIALVRIFRLTLRATVDSLTTGTNRQLDVIGQISRRIVVRVNPQIVWGCAVDSWLCRPSGLAVNDYAPLGEKVRFQSVDGAVRLLYLGGYSAKVDLQSAYRSVKLHPSNLILLVCPGIVLGMMSPLTCLTLICLLGAHWPRKYFFA